MKKIAFYFFNNQLRLFCLWMIGIFFILAKGENDSIYYAVEARAIASFGEHTPFWLVSNLEGLGSPIKNNGWVRGEIKKTLETEKRFSWGAGVDLAALWNGISPFFIQQLYGELKYRALYLMAGSKELRHDYNDNRLSTGNLLFSGNSLPIPQVRIGTYDFASFWGTNDWFSVKAYLAFGKFTDSKWVKNWAYPGTDYATDVLYHSKGLWIRGGNKEKFPLIADVGIEMGTQFGGIIYKDGKKFHMPEKFIDWLKAIFPFSGGPDTPEGEQTNVQGNMTGAYTISVAWEPKAEWKIRGYFEHYFEDHSQMTFEYGWKDGLLGLEVELPPNKFVKKFLYEFVHTKDQTGAVNNDFSPEVPEQVSGRDNYFNHYLYAAWQNWGMAIGTPLAISPIYNINHHLTFYNTRFRVHHVGFEGEPLIDLKWRLLLTYSQNWGTYRYPFPQIYENFSGLFELDYKPQTLNGWYGKFGLAWDAGKLLGNSFGIMLSLGKEGFIPLKKKNKKDNY